MTGERVVVVGAGQAGAELVAALRGGGFSGAVTLIGSERAHPYMRPPLSKVYLLGECGPEELAVREASMYVDHDIDLRLGRTVVSIDRTAKAAHLDTGEVMPYTSLVLATGGTARRLPVPQVAAASNVFYVRTLQDVDRLRRRFTAGARLAVIGAGYIGLEVASVARRHGLDVSVLEQAPRVLARVTSEPVSGFVQRIYREHGVDVRLAAEIADYLLDDDGDVAGIALLHGDVIPVDLVVVGIGLVPSETLAEEAGLDVRDGVLVDEFLRTSDPDVYAIGDVARYPHPRHGTCRLESVPNALAQARALARTLLGRPEPFCETPWFWSDMFDVKLQSVGLSAGHDELVVRESAQHAHRLGVFYLSEGRLIAADIASSPRDFAVAKRLVADERLVSPELLADADVPLKEVVVECRPETASATVQPAPVGASTGMGNP
jgi:3-phenylpropionate/trans-cinnamate dioxygenase ferredoxin reductase subunit